MLREYDNSILFVNICLYIYKYIHIYNIYIYVYINIYIYIYIYIYIFIYNLFSFISFINFHILLFIHIMASFCYFPCWWFKSIASSSCEAIQISQTRFHVDYGTHDRTTVSLCPAVSFYPALRQLRETSVFLK